MTTTIERPSEEGFPEPEPVLATTFEELGVAPELVAVLASQGITAPFPVQAITIPDGIAGRDVCGKAKTGSGKTLAFGLPLLMRLGTPAPRRPRGLVLVPTRELAIQVAEVLEAPGRRPSDAGPSSSTAGPTSSARSRSCHKGVDVVIATPGRLIDLSDRGEVSVADVEVAVLDEADRMADMGFPPPGRLGSAPDREAAPDHALLGHPRR